MSYKNRRVIAIHDLSCFGRSSLTVVIPIFSKMGIQVCPIPTALLSTHGAFKDGTYKDLTDDMIPIIKHWKELNLEFDAIYSGFLGSEKQIEIVIDVIESFGGNKPLIVVDPVMGDEGEVYSIIDSKITNKMHKLVKSADIITPNTTEAFILLNRKYKPKMNLDEAKEILKELSMLGPNIVVLTSIHNKVDNRRYTGVYDKLNEKIYFDSCDTFPIDFSGTGDAFTSIFTSSLLKGCSLKKSLRNSLEFIEKALKKSIDSKVDPNDGILLEIPYFI